MKTLFDETTLNWLNMKNRFIRSGLYTGLGGENGRLTPEIYKIYEDLAKGGVGTIITGYCYIKDDDQANQNMVGIHDDSCIEDFKRFTDMIHSHNTNVIIQIACGGSLTYMPAEGRTILGPSAVANQTTKITPTPITKEQIKELARTYGEAALRAKKSGFDGVEIHAAHGYFLSQFLCPYLNRRTDEYGGSIENRARILFDVYREVRMAVGDDYPIFFKINSADYMENGLTVTDSLYVAERLAALGVDAIDVSGGNESITESIENNLTTARKGVANNIEKESYFKDYAIELSKRVSIPVILVGGNRHIDLMEEILNNSNIEYFALGRPLTCEPNLINRWALGDTRNTKCVSCNQCYYTPGKRCFLNLRKESC
jgi:NADH:flavin oxidoreductases, Old Yellow Enzyme family